jgi:excisionase family DNA binding protein
MAIEDFGLLTIATVAELLRCSKAHISNLIAGRVRGCSPLPALRLGRRTLVRYSSLVRWIEENDRIASSPERGRKSALKERICELDTPKVE